VGLIDAGLWPGAVTAEIRQALDGWTVRPLNGLVRGLRQVPSPAELALLRRAASALTETAAAAAAQGLSDCERIALAERELRGDGYLDVIANTSRTADGVTSVRITGQYRYLWLRAARLADPDGDAWPVGVAWPGALRRAVAAAVAATVPGVTTAALEAAARPALGQLPAGTTADVRLVYHADLATDGEYANDPAGQPVPDGAVVVVEIDARFADGTHAAVAETVLAAGDGSVCLTGAPAPAAGR
jgi:Xaa-Pro aminopeptidase